MFDHTLYDAMRKKYNAEDAFPDIYEKIRPEAGLVDETKITEEVEKVEVMA